MKHTRSRRRQGRQNRHGVGRRTNPQCRHAQILSVVEQSAQCQLSGWSSLLRVSSSSSSLHNAPHKPSTRRRDCESSSSVTCDVTQAGRRLLQVNTPSSGRASGHLPLSRVDMRARAREHTVPHLLHLLLLLHLHSTTAVHPGCASELPRHRHKGRRYRGKDHQYVWSVNPCAVPGVIDEGVLTTVPAASCHESDSFLERFLAGPEVGGMELDRHAAPPAPASSVSTAGRPSSAALPSLHIRHTRWIGLLE
jgi:hypothetical protein